MPLPRPRRAALVALLAVLGTACGSGASGSGDSSGADLVVAPQNSTLLVGVNRVSIALLDKQNKPVNNATVSLEIDDSTGKRIASRPLEWIGPTYDDKPVYNGTAAFAQSGKYRFVAHATLQDGTTRSGAAGVSVTTKSPELPVSFKPPAVSQRIITDPNTKIGDIDSGVPPDDWHSMTIAQGLDQHKPMVLYFGEPGFCVSQVCGPVVDILKQLCTSYCDKMVFEHIEVRIPPGAQGPFNPAYIAFGLSSEPWIYFVNASGVVADRFEGPVTVDQLKQAADGTLAGRVPAVEVSAG